MTAIFTAAALIVTALFSFSACRDSEDTAKKGLNGWFTAVMAGNPGSLDPQTCTDDSAAQIIANVFLGLYRITDGGEPLPAMAEQVTVSDDGLVYTFKLSENVRWYGKNDFSAECTADDFVFAFQRLFDPALRSVRAEEFYCIENAEKIHTGNLKNMDELGVKATGKYELTIMLTEPRADLDRLLASAPAMPCSREYYELTEGQYGLVDDCVGSNGDFYVSRWHYDKWVKDGNFIELRRNELNAEALGTAPRGVTFMINTDGFTNFLDGKTDVYATAVTDEVTRLSGKYSSVTYPDHVWGVLFYTDGVFESSDLRIALGGFVNGDFDGGIYTRADCIVPGEAAPGSYRGLAGYPVKTSYSESELIERGERAMRELGDGRLSGMKLLVPEGTALRQAAGAVIQQWQKNFGVYCMISELPVSDYMTALSRGDFDAALVRIGGNGAVSCLNRFASSSVKNYGNVNSRKLDDILKSALTARDDALAAGYFLEAEQLILDSGWFVPLCFENEYIFSAPGVSGVAYDPGISGFMFAAARG